MSDPIDIKALDEYLKGGSDISQRYRELDSGEVPPELDRRVLDEARAAVASGNGGRSRSWLRWSAPLALAASVVLAVAVVIESGVQNDASFATKQVAADKAHVEQRREAEESKLQEQVAQEPQQESQQPQQESPQEPQRQFVAEPPAVMAPQAPAAPVPAAAPSAALAKAEAERSNSVASREEVRVDAKALRDQPAMTSPITVITSANIDSPAPQVAAEQPAPPPSVEADSSDDAVSSVSSAGTRARRAGRTAGPRGTVSGSALSGETRPAADEDADASDLRSDPLKWLESIRELRRTGKTEEADRAWQEFHQAFPNFPVADDDLARKQR